MRAPALSDQGGQSPIDVAAGRQCSVGEAPLCLPRELTGVDHNLPGSSPSSSRHGQAIRRLRPKAQRPEGRMQWRGRVFPGRGARSLGLESPDWLHICSKSLPLYTGHPRNLWGSVYNGHGGVRVPFETVIKNLKVGHETKCGRTLVKPTLPVCSATHTGGGSVRHWFVSRALSPNASLNSSVQEAKISSGRSRLVSSGPLPSTRIALRARLKPCR